MLLNIREVDKFAKINQQKNLHNKLTSIIIVLLEKENIDLIKKCIKSIKANTVSDLYEIIVIIGLDKGGDIPWIQQHSDIVLLYHHKSQENVVDAYNKAIKIAQGKQILLLNPYAIFTKHWLESMVEALYSDDKLGAIGPMIKMNSPIDDNYDNMNYNLPYLVEKTEILNDGCFLVKAAVIEQVGELDVSLPTCDNIVFEYSWRIQLAGYRLGVSLASLVYIYSDNKIKVENPPGIMDKWGMWLRLYKEKIAKSPQILEFLEPVIGHAGKKILVLDPFAVLDIAKIQDLDNTCSVCGVMCDHLVTQVGNKKLNFAYMKYWDEPLPYEDNYFDLVYMPEIWSKIDQPEKFLQHLQRVLKIDGKFVFKVKNAMVYTKFNDLISGQNTDIIKEYCYTYDDIVIMLSKYGFKIVRINGAFMPSMEHDPFFLKLQSLVVAQQRQFIEVQEFYIEVILQGG